MTSSPWQRLRAARAYSKWRKTGFAAPGPQIMKQSVFKRHGVDGATWVETGTFRGTTTRFLRSLGCRVHTIEPAEKYYKRAVKAFAGDPGVTVHNGTSETVLPELVPTLEGDVNFWLDGHYSAGSTFQGDTDCPILDELAVIADALPRLGRVAVLIDDVRCFGSPDPQYADYPPLDTLVDWARENGMRWQIEQDIFIATAT